MDTVVSVAVNICSSIYAAVGLFGYVAFHDIALHGDILLYLQSTFLTEILKIGFMLSIAVSVPLMLFPCRTTCYYFLRRVYFLFYPKFLFKISSAKKNYVLFFWLRRFSNLRKVTKNARLIFYFPVLIEFYVLLIFL